MEFVEPYSTVLVLNSSYEPLQFTNWKIIRNSFIQRESKTYLKESNSICKLCQNSIFKIRRYYANQEYDL